MERRPVKPTETRVEFRADNALAEFEESLTVKLGEVGLPVENVYVCLHERAIVYNGIENILTKLNCATRKKSLYLSKMIAASGVGLFDAALNYLWNEVVTSLRERVSQFDLQYFFEVATSNQDSRKHLKSERDLARIDDASLLEGARKIGLLDQTGYKRLDHIRYMRNFASAAHPNQVEVNGHDLLAWTRTCIEEVLNSKKDKIVAETGKLLANIKKSRLTKDEVESAAAFFGNLPQERADSLAKGLFGLYVADGRTENVADNVRMLWPKLWPEVSEDLRRGFGVRHARLKASADTDAADAARELIDLVDGSQYLNEEIRVVEIDKALDHLLSTHKGYDNFYREPSAAEALQKLVGEAGEIPELVRSRYVEVLVRVFLGNGYGVSTGALPFYQTMIEQLDPKAASSALRSFTVPETQAQLGTSVGDQQWRELLDMLSPKFVSKSDTQLLACVKDFTGPRDKMHLDSEIKRLLDEHEAG